MPGRQGSHVHLLQKPVDTQTVPPKQARTTCGRQKRCADFAFCRTAALKKPAPSRPSTAVSFESFRDRAGHETSNLRPAQLNGYRMPHLSNGKMRTAKSSSAAGIAAQMQDYPFAEAPSTTFSSVRLLPQCRGASAANICDAYAG